MPDVELKLPLLGDVMTEGTLAEWLAADGAAVRKGDPLYQLETDKVNYTVEAPAAGVLRRLVRAGETVPVGTLIGTIGSPASPAAAVAPSPAAAGEGGVRVLTASELPASALPTDLRITPAARRLARTLGIDLAGLPRDKRLREADVQAFHDARGAGTTTVPVLPRRARLELAVSAAKGEGSPPLELRATPAAKRLARELAIDLTAYTGSEQLIREADVRNGRARTLTLPSPAAAGEGGGPAAAGEGGGPAAAGEGGGPAAAGAGGRPAAAGAAGRPAAAGAGVQLSGRRRVIAERMHRSLQDMAQLTISLEIDMTDALHLREQLKQLWPEDGQPTITDLVARAAILGLRQHPNLNATLESNRLTINDQVNLGLAVDADQGLIVPVIHNAGPLSLRELAAQTKDAAARARANQLTPDDVQGGTLTITTLGALGIDFFTPIVNPPQVAILGIGRVFPKLVLQGSQVDERQSLYLNLSFDHRALDGAPAARYLNEVKRLLELPVALVA